MGFPALNFEVTTQDTRKLKAFYKSAFGWSIGKGPHKGVHAVDTGSKKGIQGFLLERNEYIPDYVSFYIGVPDLGKAIAKVLKAGGQVIRPEFSPNPKMSLAIVMDPEGHVFTLRKTR